MSNENFEKPTKCRLPFVPNLNFIIFFYVKTRPFVFPVWLKNGIQFLYQDVSIFDSSFLFTSFLSKGKQTFKPK